MRIERGRGLDREKEGNRRERDERRETCEKMESEGRGTRKEEKNNWRWESEVYGGRVR